MPKKSDTKAKGTKEGAEDKKHTRFRLERSYIYASHDADGSFNGLTVDDWKEMILDDWSPEKLKAEHVCIAFHDKDIDSEGNPKGLHAHAVPCFSHDKRKTQSAMYTVSKCSRIEDCRPADTAVGAYRYLIHATEKAMNEKKHVYDQDSVIVLAKDGVSFSYADAIARASEKKDRKRMEDAVSALLHKVSTGKLTLDEVKGIYRNDTEGAGLTEQQWHKDKRMYLEADKEWMQGMHDWYMVHNRCLTGIYISGNGESGKTDLAQAIAKHYSDNRGYHVAAAPGKGTTYDPIGKYHGEKVSIFNEMEGSNFSVKQFTDMFDPIHASDVNSRYNDKPWFASMFIFTNSKHIEDFISDMMMGTDSSANRTDYWAHHPDNKIHQIRRRFAIHIEFEECEQKFYGVRYDDGAYSDKDNTCYEEKAKFFKIYVRDAHVKYEWTHPPKSYNAGRGTFQSDQPFKLFATVYPDIVGEKAALNAVDEAIKHYYKSSGYSVTPWTVEEPDLENFRFQADAGTEAPAPAAWVPPDAADAGGEDDGCWC